MITLLTKLCFSFFEKTNLSVFFGFQLLDVKNNLDLLKNLFSPDILGRILQLS